mgnify:CR=1 FL=1
MKDPEEIICFCVGKTRQQLLTAIAAGHSTLRSLSRATGVTTGCGSCEYRVESLLSSFREEARGQLRLFGTLLFFLPLLSCLLIPLNPAGALNAREVRTLVGAAAEQGFVSGILTYCHGSRDLFCQTRLETHLPAATVSAGLVASHQAPVKDHLDYVEETARTCQDRTRLTSGSLTVALMQQYQVCAPTCIASSADLPLVATLAGAMGASACDIEETGSVFSFYQYNL